VTAALAALGRALRDLREPRMLALGLLPPLAAIAVWIGLGWAYADDWARLVAGWIAGAPWLAWINEWGLSGAFVWASGIAALALLLPLMLVAAVLVTDLVAMPVIVPFVAARHYPQLGRGAGGSFAGSLFNTLAAAAVFAALWLATLPLWLTGIGAVLAPLLTSAYLTQRVFRYDALAEHASAEEMRRIVRAARGELYLLGVLLSALLYVPLANLFVPVLAGLAFTHYCLERLRRERAKDTAATV
jgi:uncharacterized protein involved in cysteine biosynthesis